MAGRDCRNGGEISWDAVRGPGLAHIPAKWAPVRRQEYAPNNESRARSDSVGTERALTVIARRAQHAEAISAAGKEPVVEIALLPSELTATPTTRPGRCARAPASSGRRGGRARDRRRRAPGRRARGRAAA